MRRVKNDFNDLKARSKYILYSMYWDVNENTSKNGQDWLIAIENEIQKIKK